MHCHDENSGMDVDAGEGKVEAKPDRGMGRAVVSVSTAVAGVIIAVGSYFLLAAPWGFPPASIRHSDPRLPFAPTLVVLGVVLVFLAAVIYELWPDRSTSDRK